MHPEMRPSGRTRGDHRHRGVRPQVLRDESVDRDAVGEVVLRSLRRGEGGAVEAEILADQPRGEEEGVAAEAAVGPEVEVVPEVRKEELSGTLF